MIDRHTQDFDRRDVLCGGSAIVFGILVAEGDLRKSPWLPPLVAGGSAT